MAMECISTGWAFLPLLSSDMLLSVGWCFRVCQFKGTVGEGLDVGVRVVGPVNQWRFLYSWSCWSVAGRLHLPSCLQYRCWCCWPLSLPSLIPVILTASCTRTRTLSVFVSVTIECLLFTLPYKSLPWWHACSPLSQRSKPTKWVVYEKYLPYLGVSREHVYGYRILVE